MGSGQWVVVQGRLALRVSEGEIIYPAAAEIFAHAFRRATHVAGHECRRIETDLPDLFISRIPAVPAVRIWTENGIISGSFGVKAGTEFKTLSVDIDHVIVGSRWYPIDRAELESAHETAVELGVDRSPVLISSLMKLRTESELPFIVLDEAAISSLELIRNVESPDIQGLNASLYPYQEQGIRFLRMIAAEGAGCVLADEMGLGKTLQVIGLIRAELNEGRGPFLVISPATLLENWRREIAKFAPSTTVITHAGSSRAGVAEKLLAANVTLASYETAIKDESLLSSINWHAVVLDEAQAIKNPEAQRTSAVKRLPRNVGIAVSGTPLENRIDDLWSVTDFCLPGLLGTLGQFRAEFKDDFGDAARIAPIVGPIILRRRVADVAKDLPEKIEIVQPVEMSTKMAEAYEAVRRAALDEYGPAGGLVATTKLRSFCAHPMLLGSWSSDPAEDMPKYSRLVEILEEIFSVREKALIFSTFQGMADIFQRDLPSRFPTGFYRTIDGRTPMEERQPTVDAFFDHVGCGALFLNPKAAGTGLNITAANHVIHFNPEWNPALTAQASARAFRRKQTRPVTIHHLFFASSVEEVIVQTADFKRNLAGHAVTGHEGGVTALAVAQALQISPIK